MFGALDFDEAYFLQVAWHIWHYGVYGSFYQLFDPSITTGPTVILPASLFIPVHPLAPRMIMVMYGIALIVTVYRWYMLSLLHVLTWLLAIMVLPHAPMYLTHVLGEIPGLFFVVIGYVACLKKRLIWGGLLIGLAILTKQLYILAIIPLVLTRQWKVAIVALIPTALWQILLCAWTPGDGYGGITRALAWPRPDMFMLRLSMIGRELHVSPLVWLLASYMIWTYGATQKRTQALSMFCWTYGTYYLLLYSNYSYRTLFPLLVATVIIGVSLLSRRHTLALLITVSIFFIIFRPQEIEIVTYHQQKELGDFVHSREGVISGCGWQSAPELSYLAQRRINREVTGSTQYYITTRHVSDCALPPFPAKRLRCNPQHCVYQKL